MSAPPRSRTVTLPPTHPGLDDGWVAAPPVRHRSRGVRLAWRSLIGLLLAFLSLAGALTALYATTELPPIPPPPETSLLLDRHGAPLAKMHAGIDRTLISIADVPLPLRQAVVAVGTPTSIGTTGWTSWRWPERHGRTSEPAPSVRAARRSPSST